MVVMMIWNDDDACMHAHIHATTTTNATTAHVAAPRFINLRDSTTCLVCLSIYLTLGSFLLASQQLERLAHTQRQQRRCYSPPAIELGAR